MEFMTYVRCDITNTDKGMLDRIKWFKENKKWICDSVDHNDPAGCSNPECFKYHRKVKKIQYD